jgi:hypothetical protein
MLRPRLLLSALALSLLLAAPAAPQVGQVTPEQENFRAAPAGAILAELLQGTSVQLGESRDRWRQATLEGWIWAASVREERRDGLDLVVSAEVGENLRATPNGALLARVRPGMRLQRVATQGAWLRVRRAGWVWEPSLRLVSPATPAAAPAPRPTQAPTQAAAPRATPAPQRTAREFASASGGGLVVLDRPAGDSIARIRPGGTIEVLAREGDWARVRIEGWTFTAALAADAGGAVLRDIDAPTLRADPDRYRGRLVEWTVQFISLQQAERFRTDFLEGETFILSRGPGEDVGFVYLVVPAERLAEARRLAPLQRIRVLGRIRTPSSSLTDAPVVDLLEITTSR